MSIQIPRCYDSHLHLLATGLFDRSVGLHDLKDPSQLSLKNFNSSHERGEWISSFGWDHHQFPDGKLPNRKILDSLFPNRPVFLSRGDGHATWVNRIALERANLWKHQKEWEINFKPLAEFDSEGWPTGILYESAMYYVYSFIPSLELNQKKQAYLRAQNLLLSEGFTHVRDMECNAGHFNALKSLEDSGELKIFVEENFNVENLAGFETVLANAVAAKKENSLHIRTIGIKFYLDGALGSQGAWVSESYAGSEEKGFCLWKEEEVLEMLLKTWKAGLSVAMHTLGDQAPHFALNAALKLSEKHGIRGKLHLEHCEILRDETIALMKGLDVTCHLQPCHWLTDRNWLVEKQPNLWKKSFPWRRLEDAGIPFQFGSDTPIEPPSLANNLAAIKDLSARGVPSTQNPWWKYHSHPDTTWGAGSITRVDDYGKVITNF